MELLAEDALSLDNPESPTAVSAALQSLSDPTAGRILGQRARKRVEQHDWRAHVEQLQKLYHRILEERHSVRST